MYSIPVVTIQGAASSSPESGDPPTHGEPQVSLKPGGSILGTGEEEPALTEVR